MIPGFKKLTAMYVYEILSEAGEPKTREQINKALSDSYNIEITLKTLKSLLTDMMDAGLIEGGGLIERKSNLPYKDGSRKIKNTNMYTNYFVVNEFADDELLWLIHNTIFSKQLTENKSNSLVERLLKLGTKKLRSKVGSVKGMKRFYHTPNPAVSYNIDTLSSAIYEDKTVQFIYTEYKKDKQLHPISDEPIIVKPARMVPLNGFYYLIAYEAESKTIQHYRIDKIKNLESSDIKTDFSAKNSRIDIDEYLSSHSFMFSGTPISVKIKIPEDKIGLVIDRFGDKIHIYDTNDDYISIGFKSNESDLYVWALENGDYVEVIEPQSIRNRIRVTVAQMHEKYSCKDLDKYDIELAKAERQVLHNHYCFRCPNVMLDKKTEWKELTQLTDLFFENNRITDFSFTNTLNNLRKVSFENERINDLSFLYELPKLSSLFLRETTVTDISCLDELHIAVLHLVKNYDLEDYSVLLKMKYLRVLYVDYETLNKLNIEELKKINSKLTIWVEQENGKAIKL